MPSRDLLGRGRRPRVEPILAEADAARFQESFRRPGDFASKALRKSPGSVEPDPDQKRPRTDAHGHSRRGVHDPDQVWASAIQTCGGSSLTDYSF
jgi:hypothetical protein